MTEKQTMKPSAERPTRDSFEEALDRKLDEALASTYPASDPVALVMPHRASRAKR